MTTKRKPYFAIDVGDWWEVHGPDGVAVLCHDEEAANRYAFAMSRAFAAGIAAERARVRAKANRAKEAGR